MSHSDLNVSVIGVPAGKVASWGRARSRLRPVIGEQPKSLPERDHQTREPDAVEATFSASMIFRPGSLAAYAWPFATDGPLSVYGWPPGVTQSMRCVFVFESSQPVTVVSPGASTRGTIQPSSCFE